MVFYLQEPITKARLQRERDVLQGTLKYMQVRSALEGAFKPSSSADSPESLEKPPPGGPD